MKGLFCIFCLSDIFTCKILEEFWRNVRLEIIKEDFGAMCYILRRLFWCVKEEQFIDLYYAIFVFFAKSFALIGYWVLVFMTFNAFCLIICSLFFFSYKWWNAWNSGSLLIWTIVFQVFFQVVNCKKEIVYNTALILWDT